MLNRQQTLTVQLNVMNIMKENAVEYLMEQQLGQPLSTAIYNSALLDLLANQFVNLSDYQFESELQRIADSLKERHDWLRQKTLLNILPSTNVTHDS